MSQITEGMILQTLALNKKSADYEEGYAQGLKDAVKHTDVREVRENGYDYPDTKWVCANCGAEVYPGDTNYCDMCGYMIDGARHYLPKTKCRLCCYSETGLEENCCYEKYYSNQHHCKYDAEPHWIEVEGCDDIEYECSHCHKHSYDQSKYCPDCGVKMRLSDE